MGSFGNFLLSGGASLLMRGVQPDFFWLDQARLGATAWMEGGSPRIAWNRLAFRKETGWGDRIGWDGFVRASMAKERLAAVADRRYI